MKKNSLKVALNMSTLSVPEKIRKATNVVDALTEHADVFTAPDPELKTVSTAIDNLHTAYLDAADGGKSKTAAMHDMESELMKLMKQLTAYVEQVASEDENLVHLSGLDIKKQGARIPLDFNAIPLGQGQVNLQAKAHKGATYKWQYSVDNNAAAPAWVNALYTNVSRTTIKGLAAGVYLFRVVFIDRAGENAGSTQSVLIR